VALATAPPGAAERNWPKGQPGKGNGKHVDSQALVDRNLGDLEGYTAWHYWAQGPEPEKDFERLRALLPKGLERQCADNGEHPTHRLLLRGAVDAFDAWEAQFGSQDLTTDQGDTLWHMLAWSGCEGLIGTLGERLNLETIDNPDQRGLTAAMVAVNRSTRKDLEHWLMLGAHPDLKDRTGCTLLHHEARYGDADWYGRILDLGADDTITNSRGLRPADLLEDRVRRASAQESETLRRHWEIAFFHKTHM
jgi:ankyrin repeat protein